MQCLPAILLAAMALKSCDRRPELQATLNSLKAEIALLENQIKPLSENLERLQRLNSAPGAADLRLHKLANQQARERIAQAQHELNRLRETNIALSRALLTYRQQHLPETQP